MTPNQQKLMELISASGSIEEITQLIIQLTNDNEIDFANENGVTPFNQAINYDRPDVIKKLLQTKKIDINKPNEHGETFLILAAAIGNEEIVEDLLTNGADGKLQDNLGCTALMYAAENGYVNVIKQLLARGVNVDQANKEGLTALMLATSNGRSKVVQELISRGADIYKHGCDGITALDIAICGNREKIVHLIISRITIDKRQQLMNAINEKKSFEEIKEIMDQLTYYGADFNFKNSNGVTPLHLAVKNSCEQVAKELLNKNADVNVATIQTRVTPLMVATVTASEEMIKSLLDKNADIDQQSSGGHTALMIAAQYGREGVVRLLLSKNADTTKKTTNGKTALDLALEYKQYGILELLKREQDRIMKIKSQQQKLIELIQNSGPINEIKSIIEQLSYCQGGINFIAEWGTTPLHKAIHYNNIEVVIELLKRKADVNKKDIFDRTPLTFAATIGRQEIVKILLDNGADISIEDKDGNTPIMIAIHTGYIEIVKEILNRGNGAIDVDKADKSGHTPLMIAVLAGREEIVQEIMSRGADINKQDKKGRTALMIAETFNRKRIAFILRSEMAKQAIAQEVYHNINDRLSLPEMKEIVKKLTDWTGDINLLGESGMTLLHIAIAKNFLEVVRELLNKGADVNKASRNGLTALMIAVANGNEQGLKELLNKDRRGIDSINENGLTLLMQAIMCGNEKIVELLLNENADIDKLSKDGETVFDLANKCKQENILKILEKEKSKRTMQKKLIELTKNNGEFKEIQGVISELSNCGGVDFFDIDGTTPLHIAAIVGREDVVKELLDKGAAIDKKDKDGVTALMISVVRGQLNIVGQLLSRGANIYVANKMNATVLMLAENSKNGQVISLLRNEAIKIHKQMKLMKLISVKGNTQEILARIEELCINYGGINFALNNGITPLHAEAVYGGRIQIIRALLSRGAEPGRMDGKNRTALLLAIMVGHTEVTQELLGKGTDISVRDRLGYNALDMANHYGCKEMSELLIKEEERRGQKRKFEEQVNSEADKMEIAQEQYMLQKQ